MSIPVGYDGVLPPPRAHQRHPHPGESIPKIAWPTIVVGACALLVFVVSTTAMIGHYIPAWITVLVHAGVACVGFVVAHEGIHQSMSTTRWVNAVVGRLAWLFVVPMASFSAYRYLHLQHHRHANDDADDPDVFATHRPAWQLPARWMCMELFYVAWYARRLPARLRHSWRRPVAEVAEAAVVFSLYVGGICVAIVTGHFWTLAVAVLIPQRIGIMVLGWWFDWLPHHGLDHTQRENRYRATRMRLGMEWLLTPLMLSQNYHLIHHLHPWLPFYRYRHAWQRNKAAYLQHDIPITTAFGRNRKTTVDVASASGPRTGR